MATLIIDEVEVTVPDGTMILEAAEKAEIYIPHLCSHPDFPPVEQLEPAEAIYHGDKRLENKKPDLKYEGCQLCVVEIEGKEGLHRACNTPVEDKMVVRAYTVFENPVHPIADLVREIKLGNCRGTLRIED